MQVWTKCATIECSYVVLCNPDIIYPTNYLDVIASYMDEHPKVAVASGIVRGEYSTVPRGAGRVIRSAYLREVGFRYPINYGYEGWLLARAR